MKKTQVETKKLSINTATVRRLASELTTEQLEIVHGAQRDPTPSNPCGSVRAVC